MVGATLANRKLQTLSVEIRNNGVMSHTCFRLRRLSYKTNGSGADLNKALVDESWNVGQCVGMPVHSYKADTGAHKGCTDGWESAKITASGIEILNCRNDELALMGFGGDTNRSFGANAAAGAYTMSKDQDGFTTVCFILSPNRTDQITQLR